MRFDLINRETGEAESQTDPFLIEGIETLTEEDGTGGKPEDSLSCGSSILNGTDGDDGEDLAVIDIPDAEVTLPTGFDLDRIEMRVVDDGFSTGSGETAYNVEVIYPRDATDRESSGRRIAVFRIEPLETSTEAGNPMVARQFADDPREGITITSRAT